MNAARGAAFAVVLIAGMLTGFGESLAQELLVTITVFGSNKPTVPKAPINTLQDLSRAIRGCWNPPPTEPGRQPVDVSFQISFKRSGELFGRPSAVVFSREVAPEQRERYYAAVASALDLCSPLPFTDSMGGALAGRVLRVRLTDARNRIRADIQWPTPTTR